MRLVNYAIRISGSIVGLVDGLEGLYLTIEQALQLKTSISRTAKQLVYGGHLFVHLHSEAHSYSIISKYSNSAEPYRIPNSLPVCKRSKARWSVFGITLQLASVTRHCPAHRWHAHCLVASPYPLTIAYGD